MPHDDETPNGAPGEPLQPEPLAPGHEEASTPIESADAPHSAGSPWRFVPLLYFLQGLPVTIVQQVSATLFTKMGAEVSVITTWSNLLKLPWTIKPFWGPLVDLNGTKRKWVVLMQALIFVALLASALVVTSPSWFTLIVITFGVIAFLSATHDIAADGFYLLALEKKDQAFFVGVRSAAFRLAMIFGTGALVYIAGSVEESSKDIAHSWFVALGFGALIYGACAVVNAFAIPRPVLDAPSRPDPVETRLNLLRTAAVLLTAFFGFYFLHSALRFLAYGLHLLAAERLPGWNLNVLSEAHLIFWQVPSNEAVLVPIRIVLAGGMLLVVVPWLRRLMRGSDMGMAFASYFRQDRMLAILSFILFYRFGESMISSISSPFLLKPRAEGALELATKTQGFIWGTVGVLALLAGGLLGGIVISKWGIKKSFWPMVMALNIPNLAYVWLAFSQPISTADAVLRNAPENLAVFSGAWFSHLGQVFSAVFQDPISLVIAIDQFGYGFGFSAYMVYLMFVSQGTSRFQTSHYAISTGLMALGAMFAGAVSGSLQESLGYKGFFIAVCILTIPGMITLFFIPMDREDMKVKPVDID